jgi:molybdopterin converting factor small subunit
MQVRIKLYPPFYQLAGLRSCTLEVTEQATVAVVLQQLLQTFPALAGEIGPLHDDQLFRRVALVMLDDEVADLNWRVQDGSRVALAGPLQGG